MVLKIKRLVSLLLALSIITVISVSALPPAFEHTRETIIKDIISEGIGQSYEYGDKQFYNWDYSNPSDYAYNSTEIDVSSGNASLLVNTSGSAGIPPFFKILSNGYYELLNQRSQTSRHFYNETSGYYRFMSDELVQYQNEWIPFEEYPIRFILRLRNSTVKKFDSAVSISNYLSLIDNSTIWGIGVETFNGILGFYLNFQDVTNGHGQYLYWPRLKNGKLPNFNQPQYAIYPNIFAKVGAQWFNQLLNNRSLYSASSNPRNNLNFVVSSDSFELSFQTLDVTIQGFQWDFIQGFKYNTTTRRYHLITEFRCKDRGFDDIGMAFEICASPQSEGTPYEPDRFLISNDTHSVMTTIQNAWEAGTYLQNFYSKIEIISENDESFTFSFEDMENAGFSEKYLSLQELEMPNYETRKTLRAGMYGFGSYSQNQIITIDPTFSEKQATDSWDVVLTLLDSVYTGFPAETIVGAGASSIYGMGRGYESWNTSIYGEITSLTNSDMTFYVEAEGYEFGEYMGFGLYNKTGDSDKIWDESEAVASAQTCYLQSMFYSDNSFWAVSGTGNQSVPSTPLDNLMEAWRLHHNLNPSTEEMLPIKLYEGTGIDEGTDDGAYFSEASTATTTQRPTLTFDYTLFIPDPPELDSPPDKELIEGYSGQNITWIPTERSNSPDNYVVYRNDSIFESGSWSNQTPIVVDIDSINDMVGMHNFTIYINDTSDLNASDLVWLNITELIEFDEPPELNSPSDKELEEGYSGESITWIPTERTNGTDLYVVYRNGSLFDSGSWSNQTPIVVDIDSINSMVGMHNFTIRINDTIDLFALDLVWVNITPLITHWYYWTNPTITSLFNFTFNLTLRNFIVNSTTDINSSIKFQLAINDAFMYWDGGIWDHISVGKNNTWYFENQANDETIIDTYINELASEGNLSVKAFLHNDYNSTPLLDNVYIDTINLTIPVEGVFHELIKDNSFLNLGFAFDFYTVKAFMDINAYNFTNGNILSFYFLYVLPYTTDSFLNAVVLYKLDMVENLTKTIDIPKISLQTLDIENSQNKNTSLLQNYHYRDLIVLIESNGNPVFDVYMDIELVWYKTDIEIQRNFVDDIFAFDDPLDFPIFLILMPLLFMFSGDQYGLIIGLTIGLVEIILALGMIRALRSAI